MARRSHDTIWLGSFIVTGLFVALAAACGGDDDDTNGGGGSGATTTTTTTTTFTVSTTSTTGEGGAGGVVIDQQACDDAWEKVTVECALGTGGAGTGGAAGGAGGSGGAGEQPPCTGTKTCQSLCVLDATCVEINTFGIHYADCLACCDEYNNCG
jgi:hypothetical protein